MVIKYTEIFFMYFNVFLFILLFFLGFYIKTSETIVLSNEDLQFLVCSLHTGYAVIENSLKSRQTG